jgi:integrase
MAAKVRLGQWFDPDAGMVPLADYADEWLQGRRLAPRTKHLYGGLLRRHINPELGPTLLSKLELRTIRRWYGHLLERVGQVTAAKVYRLLRTILGTAVEDGLIRENPCRIKGAGVERSPERPVLSVGQVFKVADAIGDRWRALVLLAAFGHLRWGELAALRRSCVDLSARTVQVRAATSEYGNQLVIGQPKSKASERTVTFPAVIVPALEHHLATYAQPGPLGLVFVGEKGALLRRANFSNRWAAAIEAAGVTGVHFHDLRHSGNTWAASTGANIRELMKRMGHSTPDAAIRYQHATNARDRAIAEALDRLAGDEDTTD